MRRLKILVTGGAGFIGSNLANALANSELENNITTRRHSDDDVFIENEVVALDDLSLGTPQNLSKNVRFVNGSVLNYDLMLELARDCDYIFHQAALSSSPMFVDDARKGLDVNITGFINVMEASKRNKVKKVIYASSSSLYNGLPTPYRESDNARPKTFYESSFYCREIIAQTYYFEYGLDSIGLRYFSVYGPNEKHKGRFANNISQFIWDMAEKGKSPVIYGDGSQTRDFTYVEDVVQANILAMRKNPRSGSSKSGNTVNKKNNNNYIYNIGTGTHTSFSSIIEIINSQLGTDIKPLYVKNPINNYVQHTMADISLARSELSYEPKWKNVEDGIKHLILVSLEHSPSLARGNQKGLGIM